MRAARSTGTLLRAAVAHVPVRQLWVNPDCGLKTRGWEEIERQLGDMVSAAREIEEECSICHMPMSRTKARAAGQPLPGFGNSLGKRLTGGAVA